MSKKSKYFLAVSCLIVFMLMVKAGYDMQPQAHMRKFLDKTNADETEYEVQNEIEEQADNEIEEQAGNEIEEQAEDETENEEDREEPSVNGQEEVEHPVEKSLSVPVVSQFPDLPTGCESTAAAMLLQYYNIDVTPEIFASQWLERKDLWRKDGRLYGPDPAEAFIGDPFSSHGFGCYAEVIERAINKNTRDYEAVVIKGRTVEQLCRDYIDREMPVLVWATIKMAPPSKGDSWKLEDGTEFTWISGEHCLVLTGYTEKDFLFNDPQTGNVTSYPKEVVEQRFSDLGSQAVIVKKLYGHKKDVVHPNPILLQ